MPRDSDEDGDPVSESDADEQAVLRPVPRYVDLLRAIEADEQALDLESEVYVALLAGSALDGSFVYADSDDPEHQVDFGIGPGCTSVIDGVEEFALPPVRMRALVEALEGHHASICADDYGPALAAIAAHVIER